MAKIDGKNKESFELARKHFAKLTAIEQLVIPLEDDEKDGVFFKGLDWWYAKKDGIQWVPAAAERSWLAKEKDNKLKIGDKVYDDMVSAI